MHITCPRSGRSLFYSRLYVRTRVRRAVGCVSRGTRLVEHLPTPLQQAHAVQLLKHSRHIIPCKHTYILRTSHAGARELHSMCGLARVARALAGRARRGRARTKCSRVFSAVLMGMMSCGSTGSTLAPPAFSRSSTPCRFLHV